MRLNSNDIFLNFMAEMRHFYESWGNLESNILLKGASNALHFKNCVGNCHKCEFGFQNLKLNLIWKLRVNVNISPSVLFGKLQTNAVFLFRLCDVNLQYYDIKNNGFHQFVKSCVKKRLFLL